MADFPIFAGFVAVFLRERYLLAPLFLLLFINDIVDLLDYNSVCKLFADDVKLYSNFNLSNTNNSDNNTLVLTLSNLETWSRVWQMRVNISKCSVLHLGLHNPPFQYTFNDKSLPTSNSVKDLGITYNHKLQFDVYILKIVSRAFQMVNLFFRSFVSRNIQILVCAFTTYVRPILEYCTPIWSPYLLRIRSNVWMLLCPFKSESISFHNLTPI